jgi:hypothetical protein
MLTLVTCCSLDRVSSTFHYDLNPNDVELSSPFLCDLSVSFCFFVAKLNQELCWQRKEYRSFRSLYMNTASKLEPHTQTDRGTCPGVGL